MKYFGWIFLFFVIAYILPLGSRPMVIPEYKFAESAREMVLSGDYVTPQRRGETVISTPAPAYYPAAKSIQLFGKNGFAVRFPSALSAGLTALFIWILIAQMLRDEKLAALSAIIYLTSSAIYTSGTVASAGSLFAMLCTGSCGTLFIALQEAKLNRRKTLNLILCGVFAGFGFLTGGISALLIPLLAGLVYMIWDKKLRQLPFLLILIPAIAALIALPWAVAINRAEPGYLCSLVRREFASFCSWESMPWYLPLHLFALGAFPSALLIPAAGVVGKEAWKGFLRQPLFRFAFCFLFIPLVIATLNPTWDASVVLCSFAPLALLIAAGIRVYFNSGCHHRSYNWLMTAWGVLLAACGAGLAVLHFTKPEYLKSIPLTGLFYPVMGTVLIIAGIMMIYSAIGNWRSRLYLYFAGIGLVLLFMPWFFKGNEWMPGEALRDLGRRCQLTDKCKYTVVAANEELANAAAWEFDFKNIRTKADFIYGNIPVGTPKILFISNRPEGAESISGVEKAGNYVLNAQEINADPLQMLIFDLTAAPEKQ